jgi:hypothetical protein
MAQRSITRACPRCGLEVTVWPLGRGRWSSTFQGRERCHEFQTRLSEEGGSPRAWQCPEIEKIRTDVVQEHDTTASDHLSPCRALAAQGEGNPGS